MPEPITDPDQAWRLAIEILYLWNSSAGGKAAGVSPLHLAPMLTKTTKFDGTLLP